MNKSYRILVLEDVAEDAELIMNEVLDSDFEYEFRQTDNEYEFKLFVGQFKPDIILSDYRLPDYDGILALKYVLKYAPQIPFIVITGSINEETAVNCMKLGAVDYILKDKMNRLGHAVRSALKNAEIKKQKSESDMALVKRESYYRNILKYMHDDIMIISRDYIITGGKGTLLSVAGYKKDDVIGEHCYDIRDNYTSPCTMRESDCPMKQVLDTGETVRFQKSMLTGNGKTVWNDILMSPLYDEDGAISHVIESYRDITELVEAKEEILMLSAAIRQSPVSIVIMDVEGRIKYVNPKFEELTGYTLSEIGGEIPGFLNYDGFTVKDHKQFFTEVLNGECFQRDFHNRNKNGEDFWCSSYFVPYRNSNGQVVGIIEVMEDITLRLKNQKQIETDLKEKELLLHEIYHRVNNNMQIMMSLLNLQKDTIDNPQAENILRTVQLRVSAMALVENMLYQEENVAEISFERLVNLIFNMIVDSLCISPEAFTLHLDAKGFSLGLKTAQPCAIIVSELITNCIEHAYPEGGGSVYVSMSADLDNNRILTVEDRGVGIPDSIDPEKTETIGYTLIYMLAEGQMSGKVNISKEGGTAVKIAFAKGD